MAKTTKQGTIIRKIGDRTAVVETVRTKVHPLYKKRFKVVKKYLADDAKNEYKIGEIVVIEETRPISKRKRFKIVEKIGEKSMVGGEKIKGEEILEAKKETEPEEKVGAQRAAPKEEEKVEEEKVEENKK